MDIGTFVIIKFHDVLKNAKFTKLKSTQTFPLLQYCSVAAPFFRLVLAIFAGNAFSVNERRGCNIIINRKLFLQAFGWYKGDVCTMSGGRVINVNALANTATLRLFTVR